MFRKTSFLILFFVQLCFFQSSFCQDFQTVFPKGKQVFADDSIRLEWNEVKGVTDYKLFISKNPVFSTIDSFIISGASQFHFSPDENVNTAYYFFITAKKNNSILFSDTGNFFFFNPKNVAGLSLWVNSSNGVDTLNGTVYQWKDQSGKDNHLSMNNSSKQPSFVENGLNAFPNIFFDDSNDGLSSPLIVDSTDYFMCVLYNCLDTANTIRRTIHGSNNWLVGKYGTSYNIFAGAFTGGKAYIPKNYVLQTAKYYNDTLKNFINSTLYGSAEPTKFPGQIGLGSWTGSNATNGNINEWLVYDTIISDSIRLLIEKYVMDRYAPPVNLGADLKTCSFPITIDAAKNYLQSYSWSDSSNLSSLIISSPGIYTLTATDIFNRTFTDSIKVILDTSDLAVKLPSDTIICKGEVLKLDAGPEHFTYSWNTGSSRPAINVDSSGSYIVNRTNCLANTTSDTITVTVNHPEFDLGLDTSICFNMPYSLQADSIFMAGTAYLWNTGSSSSSITVDSTAWYSLKVVDDALCSYTDSIHVQIDSSLFNIDLGNDTALCEGNKIGIIHPNNSITSYAWSTGSMDSVISVDSTRTYYLKVTSSLCSYTDSIAVSIKGLAPLVDFTFQNLCFGDSVRFFDSSSSRDQSSIISWNWDFGNGNSSHHQNPPFSFDSVGVKNVSLQVETDSACSASIEKQVQVFPKPLANFVYSLSCQGSLTSFYDSSSISNGSIVSYSWNFGGVMDSIMDPVLVFDSLGIHQIYLAVGSDEGCVDTATKTINVYPAPQPAFSWEGVCLGDSTFFVDQSSIASGTINKYEWNFGNSTNYIGQNAATYYYQPGKYFVYLKTTSDVGCTGLLKDSVQIKALPTADFSGLDFCEAEPIAINSNSHAEMDSLVYFRYIFDQKDTSYIAQTVFPAQQVGNYPVKLLVKNSVGCLDSTLKIVSVHPKPIVDFKLLNNFTSVPLQLDVVNLSKMADSFIWDFGNGETDTSKTPRYIYRDTGSYQIQLKAFNHFGCSDSTAEMLRVFPSFLDAAVGELQVEEFAGFVKVMGTINNTGAAIIQDLKINLTFSNGLRLEEQIDSLIFPGESIAYSAKSSIKLPELPDFVCLEIVEVNNSIDEVMDNNKKCIAGPDERFSMSVSPNPVNENLKVDLVLPNEGYLKLLILAVNGGEIYLDEDVFYSRGYHSIEKNMQGFPTGTYLIKAVFGGKEILKKVVKY